MTIEYKKINGDQGAAEICCFDVTNGKLTFKLECDCATEYEIALSDCRSIEVYDGKEEIYEY